MNNGKISSHQLKVMVILFFIGTSVLNAPGLFAAEAKQDAWIAAIFGVIMALILVLFYNIVGEQLKDISIVEYSIKILGKWIGGLVSLFFTIFLFLDSAALVWIVGTFICTQVIPETPMIVVTITYMIVIMYGSKLGLEVIARSAEILFPWAFVGLILLFIAISPESEIKNIQPIFENGIKPIIRSAVFFEAFTPLTLVTFFMIFPANIEELRSGKNAFIKGVFTAGILIIILTLICILVMGAENTARNVYPTYALAKKISIGNFIQRIEAILGMIWIVTVFFKTVLYFYGTAVSFAQTLGLKDYKPFILPLGMLVIIFSGIIYPNTVYAGKWDTTTWVSYVITNGLFFPLLLFIIGRFRHK